jgi:hypothetical protein
MHLLEYTCTVRKISLSRSYDSNLHLSMKLKKIDMRCFLQCHRRGTFSRSSQELGEFKYNIGR